MSVKEKDMNKIREAMVSLVSQRIQGGGGEEIPFKEGAGGIGVAWYPTETDTSPVAGEIVSIIPIDMYGNDDTDVEVKINIKVEVEAVEWVG